MLLDVSLSPFLSLSYFEIPSRFFRHVCHTEKSVVFILFVFLWGLLVVAGISESCALAVWHDPRPCVWLNTHLVTGGPSSFEKREFATTRKWPLAADESRRCELCFELLRAVSSIAVDR